MSVSFDISPGFIGHDYPAFCVRFLPDQHVEGHIIYLPPFAEEMNRCRATVADQARWFAQQKYSCSILDFWGTGESLGSLSEASIDIWHENIEDLARLLQSEHEAPIILWGCRLGALIALQHASLNPGHYERLLLWQPVVSGKTFVTQILRQRVASLMDNRAQPETTNEMRDRLKSGDALEIAGYVLGGSLITQLDEMDLTNINITPGKQIFWLEHVLEPDSPFSVRSQRAADHLKTLGTGVTTITFSGAPIWQLHERDTCPDLLEKTRAISL